MGKYRDAQTAHLAVGYVSQQIFTLVLARTAEIQEFWNEIRSDFSTKNLSSWTSLREV